MAEEEAAAQTAEEEKSKKSDKPMLFIILAVVNMLVLVGVGAMLYLHNQKESEKPKIDDVLAAESKAIDDASLEQDYIGKLIPLETFLVNLSGTRGRKFIKVTMELEVDTNEVQAEIEKIKPKIRDMIIMILSSNTYTQVSSKEGQDKLRSSIRDQVNLFLTRGQIAKVYFTQFIYSD